eukprot:3211892-Amphidinium_carterae.1
MMMDHDREQRLIKPETEFRDVDKIKGKEEASDDEKLPPVPELPKDREPFEEQQKINSRKHL